MALLNTVRAVLRDVHLREQAGRIQEELRGLLENVRRLNKRVENLQSHFNQANEDVRQIQISTEKVVRVAERIEDARLDEVEGEAKSPALAIEESSEKVDVSAS
jgi:DNA recombination protein RmuC